MKIKKGLIQDSTFIYSDPGYAKADKPWENEAKTKRSRGGTWIKKVDESHFGSKFYIIIARVYEMIGRLNTTTASRHDSKVNLLEKNEVVYRVKGYFGAKSKGYYATMKRAVKNILWE